MESRPQRTQWVSQRRRAFIEHRLFWAGRLGLADLMATFDLSRAQASKELNAYKADHPDNIQYDLNAKTYVKGLSFAPQYETPDAASYLRDVLDISRGNALPNAEWYKLTPEVFSPPVPTRGIRPEILRPLLQAIDGERQVRILYQSMSSPAPRERNIAPHALCFDGFRWHCRAYCYSSNEFRDFVISRIVEIHDVEEKGAPASGDRGWQEFLILEIGPHPELSATQRRVVELDYEMTDGRAEIEVRKCMLFYTLKRLGLDAHPESRPAHRQHIVLTGPAELLDQLANTE